MSEPRRFCCKNMDLVRESGISLRLLSIAACNVTGEHLDDMRFCPWCGWDDDKIVGITKHRKQLDDADEAARIGASIE